MVYENEGIKVHEVKTCSLCNSKGILLYSNLRDRLYSVPGVWNIRKCSNNKCGLLWLDPKPVEEDINKLYKKIKTNYLAYKYGYFNSSMNFFEKLLAMIMYIDPGRRANLDFSVMYLPMKAGKFLLDLGCGDGWLLENMQNLGWKVEGIDMDYKAVKIARSKGFNVRFGKLEDQLYPDNHFDVITMSHVIEHVYDPLKILRECYRILKPKGRLIIVTPNADSLGHKIFGKSWFPLEPPRHLYIFNCKSLADLLKRSGFKKINTYTTIRDAVGSFIASTHIKISGRYVWGNFKPKFIYFLGRYFQFIENILLKFNSNIGEEILVIAKK